MKYKINNLIIDAESPVKAAKIAKVMSKCNDAYDIHVGAIFKSPGKGSSHDLYIKVMKIDSNGLVTYNEIVNNNGQYDRLSTQERSIERLKEYMSRHEYRPVNSLYDSVKDEASEDTTIGALIADEHAAIDAYNVAIENLKGKISDKAIQILEHIKMEEEEHVKELQAIENDKDEDVDLSDSIKFAIYRSWDGHYLGNGGHSWVKKESTNIDYFNSKSEASSFMHKYTNSSDTPEVVEVQK